MTAHRGDKTPAQIAEEARREAHEAVNIAWTKFSRARNGQQRHQAQVALKHVGAAIDRYAAARAVEVAEGMHAQACECHSKAPGCGCNEPEHEGSCDPGFTQDAHEHPYTDPRCISDRDRLRAELAALQEGKNGR